jgi:thiol:disulfide interchange protein DsbG
MRPSIVIAALVWSPALTAAASPPHCGLPAASAIPVADDPTEATPTPSPPPPFAAARPLPAALAALPFVRHVAAAGAVVSDLGASHGMRAIAARSGDQFMVFQVTPDGQAAVSGATVELAPAQLATIASGNITDLGEQHVLQGFFVGLAPSPACGPQIEAVMQVDLGKER